MAFIFPYIGIFIIPTDELIFPHITVWGSCFSLGSRHFSSSVRPPRPSAAPPSQLITAPLLTPHLSQHNSSTSITSLLTAQLITAPLLTPHLSHHHSSQLHFSHLTSHTSLITSSPLTSLITPPLVTAPLLTPHSSYYHSTTHHSSVVSRLPFSWQVQCGCLLRGRRSTQSLLVQLRHAWAQPSGAAAFRVAGAVHRASWSSCGARGRRWATAAFRVAGAVHRASWSSWPSGAAAFRVAGAVHRASWSSCGARGRRWAAVVVVWQAAYTEPPGRAVACVGAAGPRLPFVAGAVHRASWSSCGACGRRWTAAAFRVAGFITAPLLTPHLHSLTTSPISLPFVWQAQYSIQWASWSSCGARGRRWVAAAFRVAGAVNRASWSSCGARGRRWAAAAFRVAGAVHRASWSSCGARGRRWAAAAFRVAGAVHRASWSVAARVGAAPLFITTHHSSTSHTSLITPHFSHHNPSQLHFLHHLSHTRFDTPSLTHHLSRHLWHTIFHTTLSHTIFHTQLCRTIFHTHSFVTHHLSHTIFHTHHLSHATLSHHLSSTSSFVFPSFPVPATTFLAHYWKTLTIFHTHSFVTHHLSHTIFHTHHLSHATLSHTIFPPPPPLSFLPSPSPLQHFWPIIGRRWLVGLSGPFTFRGVGLNHQPDYELNHH